MRQSSPENFEVSLNSKAIIIAKTKFGVLTIKSENGKFSVAPTSNVKTCCRRKSIVNCKDDEYIGLVKVYQIVKLE